MEKFKEKKIVNILNNITMIISVCWFLSLIMSVFYIEFLTGFILIPIALVFLLIGISISNINEYTSEFIKYINNKINNAKSLNELYAIEKEFIYLAIENKSYCLSYPMTLKNIHININSKIEILEKLS